MNKRITLIISTESLVHSFVKDVITLSTISAGIVLNTLTINVGWLNFWLGLMGFIFAISNISHETNKRVVRGDTIEEALISLRDKLAAEDL